MKNIALILVALAACDAERARHEIQHRAVTRSAGPVASVEAAPGPAPIDAQRALEPVEPAPIELDALCMPIARATCRMHVGCRTGVSREAMLACEDHLRSACEAELPRLERRVASERLRYDATALRDCVVHLDMLACAPPAEMQAALGAACDAVLIGRLGRGAACEDAGDCAPGLACVTAAGACPGTCEALGVFGESCDAELAPCAAGLSCEAGQCAPARVTLGAPCVTTTQCPAGSFCEDLERGAVCVPRLATGRPCDDDDQCAESDYCHLLTLGDELALEVGTCASRLSAGAVCDPLVGGCRDGLACDEAANVCVPPPDSAGEPCVADVSMCGAATGLVCEQGLCELEPFVGDPCDPALPGACRFGFCASSQTSAPDAAASGECQAFLAPGEACQVDAQCGALACVHGHCDRPAGRCVAALHDINLGFRYRIR